MTATVRKVPDTSTAAILDLWNAGLNTYQIAHKLGVREAVIYNRLARL